MQGTESQTTDFFKSKVLGHPSGLFVLFFTEMWERFSYYGMRALLVLFLVSSFGLGGWEWPRENALALYGTYTSLVYITPILGGWIADRIIGYRKAVVWGALIMTLGHASMAIESNPIFLYIGIGLLIVGNGFFKPNMTSIISHMYKDVPEKKDGAYTIFYMGVNAGAFLGILLCGYLGEKVGWSYGFGLAGIFMLLGMLQFYFSQKIFGEIGLKPEKDDEGQSNAKLEFEGDRLNPFNMRDKIMIFLSAAIGVIWVINDPLSKIAGINLLVIADHDLSNEFIIIGLFVFAALLISRLTRYPKITRDRMGAIIVFAVMTVVFWMCFEQAGGSMSIFANDYTNRIMTGNYYYAYVIIDVVVTVVPVAIITWVLFKLFKQTFQKYRLANIILGSSFLIIWAIIFWKFNRDLSSNTYIASYELIQTNASADIYGLNADREATYNGMIKGDGQFIIPATEKGESDEIVSIDSIEYQGNYIVHEHSDSKYISVKKKEQAEMDSLYLTQVKAIEDASTATVYYSEKDSVKMAPLSALAFNTIISEAVTVSPGERIITKNTKVIEPVELSEGEDFYLMGLAGKFRYMTESGTEFAKKEAEKEGKTAELIPATVTEIKKGEVEIPATWFLILNSLFIIMFAPLFSKWWESKYNPSANAKYGIGLILLGIGFGALAIGASGIPAGAKTASVSLIWLVLAYLFHTLGELCLSPVALSYVSKLVPGRMIAMMFGIWYIAVAIGNKLAGSIGGQIDKIAEDNSMSYFFMIFTIVPVIFGVIAIILNPIVKKLMHGVR